MTVDTGGVRREAFSFFPFLTSDSKDKTKQLKGPKMPGQKISRTSKHFFIGMQIDELGSFHEKLHVQLQKMIERDRILF